ncbi:MAG: hypothetical protein Roseis2KO_33870 [Roseivirga sp.]
MTEKDRDLIERGILNELSPEEKLDFDQNERENEEFRSAVKLQRQMLASLEASEKVKLKTELKRIFSNIEPDVENDPRLSPKWYWLAASLIIVLVTFGWLTQRNDSDDIFDRYFDPYPAENRVRGESGKENQQAVFKFYEEGDYLRVIELLEKSLASETESRGQQLYLGNAYLASGQPDKAIKTFEGIEKNSSYYMDAQWYLALSYLKNGNSSGAIIVLKSMLNERSLYASSARELLQELD